MGHIVTQISMSDSHYYRLKHEVESVTFFFFFAEPNRNRDSVSHT